MLRRVGQSTGAVRERQRVVLRALQNQGYWISDGGRLCYLLGRSSMSIVEWSVWMLCSCDLGRKRRYVSRGLNLDTLHSWVGAGHFAQKRHKACCYRRSASQVSRNGLCFPSLEGHSLYDLSWQKAVARRRA